MQAADKCLLIKSSYLLPLLSLRSKLWSQSYLRECPIKPRTPDAQPQLPLSSQLHSYPYIRQNLIRLIDTTPRSSSHQDLNSESRSPYISASNLIAISTISLVSNKTVSNKIDSFRLTVLEPNCGLNLTLSHLFQAILKPLLLSLANSAHSQRLQTASSRCSNLTWPASVLII
mgnify:CR=1 FL=1|jgi:hypothetical protein